jgi:hypothetical protein
MSEDLEHHAHTYAVTKAREVAAEILDIALRQTQSELPVQELCLRAQDYLERRLAALLRNSLVDFTERWTGELERRMRFAEETAAQALAVVPTVAYWWCAHCGRQLSECKCPDDGSRNPTNIPQNNLDL